MKRFLIIGGSNGIGKATAEQLIKEGNEVTATYNNQSDNLNPSINYHHFDVLKDDEINFIPDQLDGIVYAPGSINLKPFHRIKPEDFLEDYKLQVGGAIKILQQALPSLKKSESASVVLFSTVAVQTGFTFHSQVSASKGAIEGLTRALAAEWAPKIRVNAIAPSLTQTNLSKGMLNSDAKLEANAARHPLKKIGSAEDIANMVSFLLSEKSSWISGQILKVDGGMSNLRV